MAKDRVLHLIKIDDDGCGLACKGDWVGLRVTGDTNAVTCQNCLKTDFYSEKVKENEK